MTTDRSQVSHNPDHHFQKASPSHNKPPQPKKSGKLKNK